MAAALCADFAVHTDEEACAAEGRALVYEDGARVEHRSGRADETAARDSQFTRGEIAREGHRTAVLPGPLEAGESREGQFLGRYVDVARCQDQRVIAAIGDDRTAHGRTRTNREAAACKAQRPIDGAQVYEAVWCLPGLPTTAQSPRQYRDFRNR